MSQFPPVSVLNYIQTVSKLQSLFSAAQISQNSCSISSADLSLIQSNIGQFISSVNNKVSLNQFGLKSLVNLLNILTQIQTFQSNYKNNSYLINQGAIAALSNLIQIMLQAFSNDSNLFDLASNAFEMNYICSNSQSNNSVVQSAIQLNQSLTSNLDIIMTNSNQAAAVAINLSRIVTILTYFMHNGGNFSSSNDQIIYNNAIASIQNTIANEYSSSAQGPSFTIQYTGFDYISCLGIIQTALVGVDSSVSQSDVSSISNILNNLINTINTSIQITSLAFTPTSGLIQILIQNRAIGKTYANDSYFVAKNIVTDLSQLEFYAIQNSSSSLNSSNAVVLNSNLQQMLTSILDLYNAIQKYSNSADQVLLNAQGILPKFALAVDSITANQSATLNALQQIQSLQSNLSNYNAGSMNLETSLASLQSTLINAALPAYSADNFIGYVVDCVVYSNNANIVQNDLNNLLNIINTTVGQNLYSLFISDLAIMQAFIPTSYYKNYQNIRLAFNQLYSWEHNLAAQYNQTIGAIVDLISNDSATCVLIEKLVDLTVTVNGYTSSDQLFNTFSRPLQTFNSNFIKLVGHPDLIASTDPIISTIATEVSSYVYNQNSSTIIGLNDAITKINALVTVANSNTPLMAINLNTSIKYLLTNISTIFGQLNNIASQLSVDNPDTLVTSRFAFVILSLYSNSNTIFMSSFLKTNSVTNQPFTTLASLWTAVFNLQTLVGNANLQTLISNYQNNNDFVNKLNQVQLGMIQIKTSDGNIYNTIKYSILILFDNQVIQQASLSDTINQVVAQIDSIPASKFYVIANNLVTLRSYTAQNDLTNIQSSLNNLQLTLSQLNAAASVASNNSGSSNSNVSQVSVISIIKPGSTFESVVILVAAVVMIVLLVFKARMIVG